MTSKIIQFGSTTGPSGKSCPSSPSELPMLHSAATFWALLCMPGSLQQVVFPSSMERDPVQAEVHGHLSGRMIGFASFFHSHLS